MENTRTYYKSQKELRVFVASTFSDLTRHKKMGEKKLKVFYPLQTGFVHLAIIIREEI